MHIEEDDMMDSVTGSVMDLQPPTCDVQHLAAFKNVQALAWHRDNLSPQCAHALAIDAGSAGDDLSCITRLKRWYSFSHDHRKGRHEGAPTQPYCLIAIDLA